MAALRVAALAGVALVSTAAQADSVTRWRPYTEEASRRFGVPLAWIERVMAAESGGYTQLDGRPITSPAGAMGLMQLMPGTWAELRVTLHLGLNPHDPHDNILAGTFYLRQMYARFGYPGLFAAYNAGPKRYAAWLGGRRMLPAETRAYVSFVAGLPGGRVPQSVAKPPQASLFATRSATVGASGPEAAAPPAAMFVRLSGGSASPEASR